MTQGKKKSSLGGKILTAITLGGIIWEERALIKRIFKEAGRQIDKIKKDKNAKN